MWERIEVQGRGGMGMRGSSLCWEGLDVLRSVEVTAWTHSASGGAELTFEGVKS